MSGGGPSRWAGSRWPCCSGWHAASSRSPHGWPTSAAATASSPGRSCRIPRRPRHADRPLRADAPAGSRGDGPVLGPLRDPPGRPGRTATTAGRRRPVRPDRLGLRHPPPAHGPQAGALRRGLRPAGPRRPVRQRRARRLAHPRIGGGPRRRLHRPHRRVTGRDRAEVGREYHGRPDKADNILDPVEAQVGWLREIGFEQADCYFKWLELAVFGGVRPTGASPSNHPQDETGVSMSRADPPQPLGPEPITAAQRDDGSPSARRPHRRLRIRAADARRGRGGPVARAAPSPSRRVPWSTLEVICHLADCEQFFADQRKRTIAMDRPLLIGAEVFATPARSIVTTGMSMRRSSWSPSPAAR